MADVWVEWNSDFLVDATGDLQVVDGDDETRQRLERRLFTAVNGYVWHPPYGAGLPQKIGSTLSLADISSVVTSQVNMEDTVAPNPPTKISVTRSNNNPSATIIGIEYFSTNTGQTVSFQITA